MRVWLIRHGLTALGETGKYQGRLDDGLSERGRAQLRRADWTPARVWVSPARRARETAAILFPEAEQITAALQKQSAGDSSWTTVETLELSAENNWKSEFYRIIEERGSSYRVRELTSSGETVEDGSTVIYYLDEDK